MGWRDDKFKIFATLLLLPSYPTGFISSNNSFRISCTRFFLPPYIPSKTLVLNIFCYNVDIYDYSVMERNLADTTFYNSYINAVCATRLNGEPLVNEHSCCARWFPFPSTCRQIAAETSSNIDDLCNLLSGFPDRK
jgi:hypothetical protein